jgi:hypothetical protein
MVSVELASTSLKKKYSLKKKKRIKLSQQPGLREGEYIFCCPSSPAVGRTHSSEW